jgi:hypothetical protein
MILPDNWQNIYVVAARVTEVIELEEAPGLSLLALGEETNYRTISTYMSTIFSICLNDLNEETCVYIILSTISMQRHAMARGVK